MEKNQAQQDIPLKNGHPDVEALMMRIRARVKADLGSRSGQLPRYVPPQTRLFEGDATQLLHSDELNYLNASWNSWSTPEPFSSHRKIVGPFIVKAKNAIRRFIADSLFKTYFERERQFHMQLVKHLNATARYIDIRDGALFWQLVQKMDSDIAAINERGDRLYSEAYGQHSMLDARLDSQIDGLDKQIAKLAQAVSTLHQDVQLLRATAAQNSASSAGCHEHSVPVTPSLVSAVRGSAPIPPGMLDLTAATGTVDPSSLDSFADKSVDGVFIGGLPFSSPADRIPELLAGIIPKLTDAAHVVIESVNPLTVAGRLFLTSRGMPVEAAISPDVLQDMLEAAGFLIETVEAGQLPGHETLGRIESSDIFPARWRTTIEAINRNSRRVNDVLFGSQMIRIHAKHADEASGAPTLKMQVKSGQ